MALPEGNRLAPRKGIRTGGHFEGYFEAFSEFGTIQQNNQVTENKHHARYITSRLIESGPNSQSIHKCVKRKGIDSVVERFFMANSGNIGNTDAKASAELPKEVEKAIWLAVRRAINGLKREVEAKRPRTVVEKSYNIGPGAFEESLRIHALLVQENERAERLLLHCARPARNY